MIALSVISAALVAGLLVRPPLARTLRDAGPDPRGVVGVVVAGVTVLVLAVSADTVALVLIGVAAFAGGSALWRRRRAEVRAMTVSHAVVEVCELLAAELSAGQPPGSALEHAARAWSPLASVGETFRVGGDVADALDDLSRRRGASDLRHVAAAWRVAHRTGQGLADAVSRVAVGAREAEQSRQVVRGELASARSTARLMAALPVMSLTVGSGSGGDPWAFLLHTPAGLACLAAGLAFALAGLWWIESLAGAVEQPR